jgi:palmitoyl transferase
MNARTVALLLATLVSLPGARVMAQDASPASPTPPATTGPAAAPVADPPATAAAPEPKGWFGKVKHEFGTVWKDGGTEVYVPFLTYHLPFWYTEERIDEFCQYPMGAGVGRGLFSPTGTWRGLAPMVFLDSHCDPEPFLGYGWVKNWGAPSFSFGLGYTAFITMRSDFNWIPIPGVLPVFAFQSGPVALQGTYIPGAGKNGNVLFLWAKLGSRRTTTPVMARAGAGREAGR